MEQFPVASLSDEQLQKVKQLEQELDTILIAYDAGEKEE